MVGVGAGVLAAAALQGPPVSADPAAKGAYAQPKAGSWKFRAAFDESEGTLKVKAGANGKAPKVKSIKITVTEQDNGAECPPPGAVVKVKGSFALRKAPKWADDDYDNEFAWISAKKDKPYDDDYPNMLGMKPVPANAKVEGQSRDVELTIAFVKSAVNKPHQLDLAMRLFRSDGESGWCIFDGEGKPGS